MLGLAAVPLVLFARGLAVVAPLAILTLGRMAPLTLIWAGLRGGISVALALGLPDGPARSIALAATYVVVLFSVIVQGGTIERISKRTQAAKSERSAFSFASAGEFLRSPELSQITILFGKAGGEAGRAEAQHLLRCQHE